MVYSEPGLGLMWRSCWFTICLYSYS